MRTGESEVNMRYLSFTLMLVVFSVFKCTGVHAAPVRDCKRITEDLRQIAWNDPDAFDIGNLESIGTVRYMCLIGEPGGRLKQLCKEAIKARCRP